MSKYIELTAAQSRAINEVSIKISRIRNIAHNQLGKTFRGHIDGTNDLNTILECCDRLDGYIKQSLIKTNPVIDWFKRLIG